MKLHEISIESMSFNPFTAINKDWMLITAGNQSSYNTMTASWGSLGELWGHYVSTIHIRPQRYTHDFIEKNDFYSLSFFRGDYRKALTFCGSKSGRDYDKAKECALTPVFEAQAPYFQEAGLVFICRKLYRQDMKPDCFHDKSLIEACYPDADFHTTYIGGIVTILSNESS